MICRPLQIAIGISKNQTVKRRIAITLTTDGFPRPVFLVCSFRFSGVHELGAFAAEGSAAATCEKTVQFGITTCAQGPTLGLSVLPNCPRFSHVSQQSLLPRRLIGCAGHDEHGRQGTNPNPIVLPPNQDGISPLPTTRSLPVQAWGARSPVAPNMHARSFAPAKRTAP